ncbi:unnamed protein product [Leptidea sinapis]|uniref:Protein kinase domain-containing protein n=1 Tax=Leptidea sinapis TaxID=189913 RepID=A0A5E4QKH4_9NEOP|nr:unnamed protein product [Leptidea sinapis]
MEYYMCSSAGLVMTSPRTAKLADLSPCARLPRDWPRTRHNYDVSGAEPHYENIDEAFIPKAPDLEPLLSSRSEEYLKQCVHKEYAVYRESQQYMWQAPELFEPDDKGLVHACSRTDVYSLCLILWEFFNSMEWSIV